MPGLLLCEPTELYNILNQATKLSRLTDPNYLCLLDVRSKWEYDESHVITALGVKKELDAFQPYPIEIVPGKVFIGNFSQACDPKIQKDLKIKAHVNVSMDTGPFFAGDADKLLHIRIKDSPEAQILPFLRHMCHFIEVLGLCQEVQKQHVSKSGIGESAAGMGEDYPWRFHHKHHGSALLIFSAAHRRVLKSLDWGHFVGGGPECVYPGLSGRRRPLLPESLMLASCTDSSQVPVHIT
ncbi:serine/threonine/tyrosine-interacting-like protein 1 isoform X5 [Pan troglodytes]|uniref:serine/threonine/tyrosine-interacting-like protein 1 isoform X5 n=1 Tax=Pan troglodytes TaxID=9598 RepID=UPI0007DB9FDC|nr:serine/threonine/tyrosine-interacting-like protein 1 isoform X7 [Pan troglodytes]